MSLNSCAPVCVRVLAKPVTNSVYCKAAASRLPRQGYSPTAVVREARSTAARLLPHTRTSLKFQRVSSLNRSQHWAAPFLSSGCLPVFSPRPSSSLSIHLLIGGWGPALSESRPENQSELLWGIPGDSTQDPSGKRIPPKDPLSPPCCNCTF